jgi:hypothetical protein
MIVHICIHVPDTAPEGRDAIIRTNKIEQKLTPALNHLTLMYENWEWWIDVENGETRYKPENVSELS